MFTKFNVTNRPPNAKGPAPEYVAEFSEDTTALYIRFGDALWRVQAYEGALIIRNFAGTSEEVTVDGCLGETRLKSVGKR